VFVLSPLPACSEGNFIKTHNGGSDSADNPLEDEDEHHSALERHLGLLPRRLAFNRHHFQAFGFPVPESELGAADFSHYAYISQSELLKCGDLTFMPGTPIASDASPPLHSPHSQSPVPSARSQIPIVTLSNIKQA
jgi:hypothetical protein